jgi:hypothetical protein
VFGIARPDRVLVLHGRHRQHRMCTANRGSARLGQTEVANFPFSDQVFHRTGDILDGHVRIDLKPELRRNDHVIPNRRQRLADDFLAQTRSVDLGRVETAHAARLADSAALGCADDSTCVPLARPARSGAATAACLDSGTPVETPSDLTRHDCINIRFLTHGGL